MHVKTRCIFCVIILIVSSFQRNASGRKSVSLPLMDAMRATLQANLDVAPLKQFIEEEIENAYRDKMVSTIEELKNNLTNIFENNPVEAKGQFGSTFVRWGRTSCDGTKSSLVYKGFMAGSHHKLAGGGGSNSLCLPDDPEISSIGKDWNQSSGLVYGFGWELTSIDRSKKTDHIDDKDIPCAVCLSNKSTILMIPGRSSCYAGWTMEYNGFMVSNTIGQGLITTEYVCADGSPEFYGSSNHNQGMAFSVKVRCGSIPCDKYPDQMILNCVVCSK